MELEFSPDSLEEVADFAQRINDDTENIGARRLYTILEKILSDLSFEASERSGDHVLVDGNYVREKLQDIQQRKDLSRYIL